MCLKHLELMQKICKFAQTNWQKLNILLDNGKFVYIFEILWQYAFQKGMTSDLIEISKTCAKTLQNTNCQKNAILPSLFYFRNG